LREQAQLDLVAREHAEEKLQQLQRDLCIAQTHINQLQQQNVKLSSKVRQLKRRMGHYNRGLIILVSQRLDSAPQINSNNEEEESDSGSMEGSIE